MKSVIIFSSDAVPLPFNEEKLSQLPKEERSSFLSKYAFAEPCGIRSWKFAEILSKSFDVTLLVPDIYFPEESFIDKTSISFKIDPYNFRTSSWNWTQELDRKLKKADFVIMQPTSGSGVSGAGIQNCAVLPSSVNLIVDGWEVLPLELPGYLLTQSKICRKVSWQKAILQYSDLLKRANCLLVANDRQQYFYEGLFYGIDKHNYSSFQFSPILKVPYGVEKNACTRDKLPDGLKILWVGPIYPWDCPEDFIKELAEFNKVTVDFYAPKHPRQSKVYNTYFKPFFDRLDDISNMSIITAEETELKSIASNYDFAAILSRSWISEGYLHKAKLIEALSYKLPAITNSNDPLLDEFDFLGKSVVKFGLSSMSKNISLLLETKNDFKVSEDTHNRLTTILDWGSVLSVVSDYITNF